MYYINKFLNICKRQFRNHLVRFCFLILNFRYAYNIYTTHLRHSFDSFAPNELLTFTFNRSLLNQFKLFISIFISILSTLVASQMKMNKTLLRGKGRLGTSIEYLATF